VSVPTPIKQVGNLPEQGRIRVGVKTEKAMKTIDTFRFTSVDRAALEQLAGFYGGTVRPWHEPRANPPHQFELISKASEIDVVVQPNSIDVAYELWAGGGRERSCDGEMCEMPSGGPYSSDYESVPCPCFAAGVLECKVKTRVNVIIPQIHFSGTWRWESNSETARHTLPSMMEIIDLLQAQAGLVPIQMVIVPQEIVKRGQKRKFMIVQFRTKVTVDQMLSGTGTYSASITTGAAPPVAALHSSPSEQAPPVPEEPARTLVPRDEEIVDAELVDDEDPGILTFPMTGLDRATAMQLGGAHNRRVAKEPEGWTVR